MSHKCELDNSDSFNIWQKPEKGFYLNLKRKIQRLFLISPSHPIANMFFRSEIMIKEEQKRQLRSKYPFIIHPLSKFRLWYETYLIFLYLLALIMNPIEMSFARKTRKKFMPHFYPYQTTVDLLCQLDVILNFSTGYFIIKTKEIVLNPSTIAKHYALGPFFICDVLSSIPRHLPYFVADRPNPILLGIMCILRCLKIPRIISLLKIFERLAQFNRIKSPNLIMLCCIILVTMLTIHWLACFQYAVPNWTSKFFKPHIRSSSWIFTYGIHKKKYFYQYIHAVFRTSAYLLGVRLRNMYTLIIIEDYVIAICTFIIGKILVATLWIILAVAILNSRSMDIKFHQIINQLQEYMQQKRLPMQLRTRILEYYSFKYQKKYLKDALITKLLSETLKREVNMHSCKSLIANVSLFTDLSPEQMSAVVAKLIPEIFLPTDQIIQSGTPGDAMYFLDSGTVAVYTHSGREICHLTDGAYFGEVSLVIKGQMRVTTIVALEITKVYRLNKRDFEKILMKNKTVLKKIVLYAERRLKSTLDAEDNYKKMQFEQTYNKQNQLTL